MTAAPPPGNDELLARTQWDTWWVPPDVQVIDRSELLVLCCPRDVAGLNSVQRLRGAGPDLDRHIDEVLELHAGRRSRWTVGPLEPVSALERRLSHRGFRPGADHHGMVHESAELGGREAPGITAEAVVDAAGLEDWLDVSARAFDLPRTTTPEERILYLAARTGPGARVHRVLARDAHTGEALSAGGLSLFPDLGFGFLWAGGTVPEGRGRGAYRAVLAARARFAQAHGIPRIGLYARVDTSAPIVARLGFRRGGPMRFWEHGP